MSATVQTESELGGFSIWYPCGPAQEHFNSADKRTTQQRHHQAEAVIDKFFSVLSMALTDEYRSDEFVAKLDTALEEAGDDMMFGIDRIQTTALGQQ